MPSLGQYHLVAAVVALATGSWVLLRPKGTAVHRRAGWLYAASMIVLNGTALLIYRLTGTFGPFHIAAIFSLATLLVGLVPMIRRPRPARWLERHYFFMAYSYLGLLAAAVAEIATRVPAVRAFAGGAAPAFWVTVAATSFAVLVIGSRMIRRRVDQTIRPFRRPPPAVEPGVPAL